MVAGENLVIGVGNEYRRDDGAGLRVLAALTGRLPGVRLCATDGEPARMLDLWAGAALAVVVDAVRVPGRPAGTWFELAVTGDTGSPAGGTHGVGLGTAVALGRELGRLPRRLVVLAVCGRDFGFGTGLSPAVEAAVDPVADRVCALVAAGP
jgi:hydrogenase maturation protease